MAEYAPALEQLIEELKKLPGIGRKSAQRMAFHLLKVDSTVAEALARAIQEVKERVTHCSTCFQITDQDPCRICSDATRDHGMICVVEEPNNVLAIEKTGQYRGLYHVLMGSISPLQGIGPEELKIEPLLERLRQEPPREVILAMNPTADGEATAIYLHRLLQPMEIRASRLAMGLPVGSDLEFTDQVTLQKAMEGRRDL
jgi:recombination protein RecR